MEIKPQELRIGNWVKWPNEKEPNEVQWDHGHWLGVFEKNYGYPHAIELTPEWLERFGFKRTQIYENVDEWYKKPLSLQTDQEIFMVTRIGTDDLELKHVHQLQNLFYSLTGEELAIDKQQISNGN